MIKRFSFFSIFILFISCNPISKYEKAVLDFRALKDEQFKSKKSSPLLPPEVQSFDGLPYFPPNEKYRIQAKYKPSALTQYVDLYEGAEVNQIHRMTGVVEFVLNKQSHKLHTFQILGQAKNQLFVPFTDLSNKKDTYPGGRYVEAHLLNDSTCTLDFNFSYNPFCVYNEKYTCALIPIENFVNDSILAGEKYATESSSTY